MATTVPTTTTTTVAPSGVTVLVLNGGTTEHAALYFQTKLQDEGYDTLAPSDATTDNNKLTEVLVNKSAVEANALAMAKALSVSPSAVMAPTPQNDAAVPADDLRAADIIVVVGLDISAQVPQGYDGPTTTAPATTVAATTTSMLPATTVAGAAG